MVNLETIATMKTFYIIFAAATLLATSCNKMDTPTREEAPDNIKFEITVGNINGNINTKAVKIGWVSGDKINLWFGNYANYTPDIILTYDGSNWIPGDLRSGASLNASGNLKALYEGFNDFTGDSYTGRTGGDSWSWSYARSYTNYGYWAPLIVKAACTYSYSGGVVSATINNWNYLTNVQVVISGLSYDAEAYSLSCDKLDGAEIIKLATDNITLGYGKHGQKGVSNGTGAAAFYFVGTDASAMSYTFTLTLNGGFKTYKYSTSDDKELKAADGSALSAISIPFSKFVEQ